MGGGICMIASRLFEHYLSAPTPPPPPPHPPSVFLWLSAVRVHTHPWAKESKIDHTSNWSRCTGTGSSSRADLSHAGKIMHPELTAQHTRLPSTSFLKRSRNFPIGRKKLEKKQHTRGNVAIRLGLGRKWLPERVADRAPEVARYTYIRA